MAHKKKPYVIGQYRIIDLDKNKEIARNLTQHAVELFIEQTDLDYCEINHYYKIEKQTKKT